MQSPSSCQLPRPLGEGPRLGAGLLSVSPCVCVSQILVLKPRTQKQPVVPFGCGGCTGTSAPLPPYPAARTALTHPDLVAELEQEVKRWRAALLPLPGGGRPAGAPREVGCEPLGRERLQFLGAEGLHVAAGQGTTPLLKSLQEEGKEGMDLTPRGSGRLVPGR